MALAVPNFAGSSATYHANTVRPGTTKFHRGDTDSNLSRCDIQFPLSSKFTYANEPLYSVSCIDYLVSSSPESVITFNVLDLDVNLSDPMLLNYHMTIGYCCNYLSYVCLN